MAAPAAWAQPSLLELDSEQAQALAAQAPTAQTPMVQRSMAQARMSELWEPALTAPAAHLLQLQQPQCWPRGAHPWQPQKLRRQQRQLLRRPSHCFPCLPLTTVLLAQLSLPVEVPALLLGRLRLTALTLASPSALGARHPALQLSRLPRLRKLQRVPPPQREHC